MNIKGLDAFLAIAMGQTLSRAAEVLKLQQSTVSHRLKQLEMSLGTVLVDRQQGAKSVVLTSAGERLLPLAIKWQDMQREIRNTSIDVARYSLIIGGVDSFNLYVLPPIVEALQQHSPPVSVIIRTQKPHELYQMLEDRLIDVAFIPQAQHISLIAIKPFLREPMWIVRKAGPTPWPEQVRSEDLDPACEVRVGWGSEHALWHDTVWGPLKAEYIRVDTLGLVRTFLRAEKQWAIVPATAIEAFRDFGFAFQRLDPPPPDHIIYQATLRLPRSNAAPALKIMDSITNHLKL